MCHHACIWALTESGASTQSIAMIYTFLRNRRITFKVNGARLSERTGRGGSSQGTKLGNYLFILTINCIEQNLGPLPPDVTEQDQEDEDCYGLRSLVGRISAIRRFDSSVRQASTPCKMRTTGGVMRYLDSSGRENSPLGDGSLSMAEEPLAWCRLDPWILKYVYHVNSGERHYVRNASSIFSHTLERKRLRAVECQRIFENIANSADKIQNEDQ